MFFFFFSRGEVFIKGPWFLRPSEVLYVPGRTFYKQEMILGSLEEIHPVSTVVGRCCIMEHSEYISCKHKIFTTDHC